MLLKCATTDLHKLQKFKFLLPSSKFSSRRAFNVLGTSNRLENKQSSLNISNCNLHQPICKLKHSHNNQRRELSFHIVSRFVKKIFAKMDEAIRLGVFIGETDRFDGITVDTLSEFDEKTNFEQKLKKSIEYWKKNKKRAIWFRVRSEHSAWIPVLTKYEFDFHHAGKGYAALQRWLPQDEYSNLPDYAHSLIGVGGLVINRDKMEVLVVTDRYAAIPGSWKLPGGYVDPKENLIDAAKREVKEETGVEGEFRTMVSLRHSHGGNFGCSDLYFVIALFAKTLELKPCEREISRVRWMPIAEYLHHPHVHETNRHTMRTYLDYERRGLRLECLTATHQILKKEYQLFFTRAIDECEKIKVPSQQDLAKTASKTQNCNK